MSAVYAAEPRALLTELSPRLAFAHEPANLTPWLRRNLAALSKAIDIPLQLLDEKASGEKRIADMLARDVREGGLFVIENQLEPSDDAHLGQILCYCAALDAVGVVWIATSFACSHLAAAHWLNVKGAARVFAVRLRVAQAIGSAPAVIFEILERPSAGQRVASVAETPVRITLDGFAAGFWAAHLRQFPEEAKVSRPVGEFCRWRATLPETLVIAQRIEAHAASVFVRGRNGVKPEIAGALLAPFAQELEARLEVELNARPGLLAHKSMKIDLVDPANWPRASNWLHNEARAYAEALCALVGENRERTRRSLSIQESGPRSRKTTQFDE